MPRTKSSAIARLKDLIKQLTIIADDLSVEHDTLMVSSDRLKEIEPALNKLQAALSPPVTSTLNTEPITTGTPAIEPPASEPVKRSRRIKKKLSRPDHTDEETPPQ